MDALPDGVTNCSDIAVPLSFIVADECEEGEDEDDDDGGEGRGGDDCFGGEVTLR